MDLVVKTLLAGFFVAGACLALTASKADVEKCMAATGYSEGRCVIELTR